MASIFQVKQIDWAKVITNLNPRFVLARATHMTGDATDPYEDTLFSSYWAALAAHGLLRGAYVFCHPLADAKATTDRFFDVYKPQPGDLVPALDIEDIWDNSSTVPVQARIGLIKTMVDAVSSCIGGQKPMIYTKTRVWNDLGNPAQFANCPLWILNYQTMPH
jgi:GH25 family lysozyme M1 (1,4-beta-N-acetylmuramidase)